MIGRMHGLQIITASPLSRIENWLEDHCRGNYELRLEGVSRETGRKQVAIYFESDGDRMRFKAACLSGILTGGPGRVPPERAVAG